MKAFPQQVTVQSLRYLAPLAYLATIVAANWALTTYGFVSVGFGLIAPAGVFFAGLAFTLRDITHESLGRWWVVGAIVLGAGLSYWVSAPFVAQASGIAFLCSELADMAVYEPLRQRRWLLAVACSNVVGFVVDSALFLWLAFGSLEFIQGQLLGKFYMTALAIAVLFAWRKWNAREQRLLPEVQG